MSHHSDNDHETLVNDLQASFGINVIGVINTIQTFVPLLRKGNVKKVFTLSTGMADIDLINQVDIAIAAPYAISKAAVNVAVAKYNALYATEGILFMAVSPGLVDTVAGDGPGTCLWSEALCRLTYLRSGRCGHESLSRHGC